MRHVKHKPKNTSNRTETNRRDRLVGKYAAVIRTIPLRDAVYDLKTSVDPLDLFAIFPRLFKDARALEPVHGKSFPKTLQQLFSGKVPYSPAPRRSEIVWAICRCIQNTTELQEFNNLRQLFERGILEDAKDDALAILDTIEAKCGQSTWLMQAKLCTSQHWGGRDELQRLAELYEAQLPEGAMLHLLFWFFKQRIEATSLKDHLKTELSRILQHVSSPELDEYLTTKLFEQADVPLSTIASCLFYEGQSSVIDLYEMLVHALQSIASFAFLPEELHAALAKPVNVLFTRINDSRLRGVLRRFGTIVPETSITPPQRAMAIEAYTRGNYAECAQLANGILKTHPDDIGILALALKAQVHFAREPSNRTGILNTISAHLLEIFRFTQDAYSAAHEIMTLADRFYGQAWISYIRALVMYELREESTAFPPLWLRDTFVRDPWLSPFSAVGMERGPAAAMLSRPEIIQSFPATLAIYKVVSTGVVSEFLATSDQRVSKYLATYHLAHGDPRQALTHYKSLMQRTTGPEKIRCAGGAALANLKIGDLKDAAEILVRAFLENPNVPSALPIKAVVDALGDPEKWPNSIAVPLVFELYLVYASRDKLAHLRYSFEKFQSTNNITNPTALVARADQLGMDMVVAYLERVWRPEIMRQTLLYDGTREIEEARIQVCRALSELLPEEKAAKYLDEIKERVKQQEIAKGTTLVEQSKVYVDIDAIKKTLRTKLGDAYARYKLASSSTPSQPDELVEKLSKAFSQSVNSDVSVAKILSGLILLDKAVTTEADAQFTALFTEVTNEFLRGDHGLNAYLSTRVRHGALSNTLRKPVEDENLVTPRDENRTSYIKNTYWLTSSTPANSDNGRRIIDALDAFSREFDGVLDQLKDKRLQIRVMHDLADSGDNPDALFLYRSSNLERRLMQEYDRTNVDMEQLLDRCVDTLWEKTDENLTKVRRVIESTVRDQLMQAFDNLTGKLASIDDLHAASDLRNAVVRAKTHTQISLGLVSSWFKRNEVYDRQDYSMDFPVHIAVNMVQKTISIAAHWSGIQIKCNAESGLLPGRTLDGMVYIFYGLLENAIKRSKVPTNELFVQVELSFDGGRFNARIINNINRSAITPVELTRIDQIRDSLQLRESNRLAQGEGRSGLHKVWLAINAPIYRSPSLTFNIEGDSFVVDLSYSLERTIYANTAN